MSPSRDISTKIIAGLHHIPGDFRSQIAICLVALVCLIFLLLPSLRSTASSDPTEDRLAMTGQPTTNSLARPTTSTVGERNWVVPEPTLLASSWITNGPFGGGIFSLAMAPNDPLTLYAGTLGAGVFKTVNGGATWSKTSLIDAQIIQIVVDPTKPETIYAVNSAVFKSVDAGLSWTKLNVSNVNRVAVNPFNSEILYAGVSSFSGRLLKSTNGGATWTVSSSGLPTGNDVTRIEIDPKSPSIIYAGSNGLYKSTNGGETWNPTGLSSSISSLVIDPTNPSILYAGETGIQKSLDGGATWSSTGSGISGSVLSIVLNPTNPNLIFAGTTKGVFKTSDAGANWNPVNNGLPSGPDFLGNVVALSINPQNPSVIYCGIDNRGGLFKSTDAGDNWSSSQFGLSGIQVSSITVDPTNPFVVYAGTNGGMFKSTDRGKSWFLPSATILNDPRIISSSKLFANLIVVDPNNTSTIYAGTHVSGIYKSTDAGANWRLMGNVGNNTISALAIHPTNPLILFAGTTNPAGGVFKTLDGGQTWSRAGLDNFGVGALLIDPAHPSTLYASNVNGVHKSLDSGINWTRIDNGFAADRLVIDSNNTSIIYATSADTLRRSEDGGATWSLRTPGFPVQSSISGLVIDQGTPSILYAGVWLVEGFGGVYRSVDGGNNWLPFNEGLADLGIISLRHDSQTRVLYAGTFSGIYLYDFNSSPTPSPSPSPTATVSPSPSPSPCGSLTILSQPSGQTVFFNQTVISSVTVAGTGSLSYQWYVGFRGDISSPIAGATSNTYVRTGVGSFNRTRYWVRIQDICGNSVDSEAALIVTTDKRPLIFIPGIGGSVLAEQNGTVWWPPSRPGLAVCNDLDRLSLNPGDAQPALSPNDVIRSIPISDLISTQIDGYGSLLSGLTNAGYREVVNQTLFILPYDWRRTNVQAASSLQALIGNVRNLFPNFDVDILAHSMGGLLAQRYVIDNPTSHHINKFITIGTPWLGTPKAINVLETGQFLEFWGLTFCAGTIKRLAVDFRGMHELLPSSKYFDLSTVSSFSESGWDIDRDGNSFENYDYENLVSLLDQQYPITRPGLGSSLFHNRPGQDEGGLSPSNISYYHISGRQAGDTTIGQLVAKRSVRCAFSGCFISDYIEPKMTAGDGTVPLLSALREGRGNLNGNHTLISFIATTAAQNKLVEHLGLCNNPQVISEVLHILSDTKLAAMTSNQATVNSVVESQASYYVQIIGNPSITVTDADGKTAVLNSTSLGTPIAGMGTWLLGENAYMLSLATDQSYTVMLRSGSEPLAVNITRGSEVGMDQSIHYKDLELPRNVMVMLRFTPTGVEDLKYDGDGDGGFEITVQPFTSATGSAARDIEAPTVTISTQFVGNNANVTITSTDAGAGINRTYFSLNGKNFQEYTGPFTVTTFQAPVLYAFADDNVGNRSGLVTKRLVSVGIPVLITQANSTRAIAFDSVLRITEPFQSTYDHLWGTDRRTRLMLFAMNFELADGEGTSSITATAEDASHRMFPLNVEHVGKVPGAEWMTSIVVRLDDDMGEIGDVQIRITYQGVSSNAVRVGIGHVGGP